MLLDSGRRPWGGLGVHGSAARAGERVGGVQEVHGCLLRPNCTCMHSLAEPQRKIGRCSGVVGWAGQGLGQASGLWALQV